MAHGTTGLFDPAFTTDVPDRVYRTVGEHSLAATPNRSLTTALSGFSHSTILAERGYCSRTLRQSYKDEAFWKELIHLCQKHNSRFSAPWALADKMNEAESACAAIAHQQKALSERIALLMA